MFAGKFLWGKTKQPDLKHKKKSGSIIETLQKAEDEQIQGKTTPQLEQELYTTIHNFLIIAEIFVCAPVNAHLPLWQSNQHWPVTKKYLHLIWCVVVYVILAICVYGEYTELNIDLPTVQKPLYFCEYLVYLVHIPHIIVASYYVQERFHAFLHTIISFDLSLLADYNVQPKYHLFTTFLNVHLLLVLVHFICTLVIDYFYTSGVWISFIRSSTVYMLPNNILHISLIQYYALLHAIAIRAQDLNTVLELKLSKQTKSIENTLLLQCDLHKIRQLYSKLELFCRDVNDAFAQSIVMVYIGSYMNLSVNIFLIYKYLNNTSTSDMAWIMYSVVWSIMHISKMFLILYYNYCVQNEKNNTALLLNDVKGQNAVMEETITHFILQLIMNTRSNVVCGVAELNMNFATSLLVAISTLFIFLLQYDITYEALTKTFNSANPTRLN